MTTDLLLDVALVCFGGAWGWLITSTCYRLAKINAEYRGWQRGYQDAKDIFEPALKEAWLGWANAAQKPEERGSESPRH